MGPLLPASWCSPEWEGPRRSCPALKGHRFTNTAQLEPPSPALTSPCGLLTILHLIYQLCYNVVCIYDLILIWTISRSGEGADSLFFYFIAMDQTQFCTHAKQALYSQPLIFLSS